MKRRLRPSSEIEALLPAYLSSFVKAPAVCRTICEKPLVKDNKAKVHFVDDRVETCRAVSECPELKDVSVYMADW